MAALMELELNGTVDILSAQFQKAELKLSIKKFYFGKECIEFSGNTIFIAGIASIEERITDTWELFSLFLILEVRHLIPVFTSSLDEAPGFKKSRVLKTKTLSMESFAEMQKVQSVTLTLTKHRLFCPVCRIGGFPLSKSEGLSNSKVGGSV